MLGDNSEGNLEEMPTPDRLSITCQASRQAEPWVEAVPDVWPITHKPTLLFHPPTSCLLLFAFTQFVYRRCDHCSLVSYTTHPPRPADNFRP